MADRSHRARASRARSARPPSRLVRILFPGAGLLVLSAWCLGVLNSHRRFFLSYVAPVVWNLAIIARAARVRRRRSDSTSSRRSPPGDRWSAACCSSPCSCRPCSGCSADFGRGRSLGEPVRAVIRNFVPVFVGRGVVQISAYVDTLLASLLPTGAVAGGLLRAGALHAAGEPLRHVGLGRRAAGDVERDRDRRRARGVSARQAGGGAPADRVLRRAVGAGIHRAGRRGDRRALPVGGVHPRDDAVRLGHSRGGLGGAAALHARAGSTPRRSTRCTTPGRRSASRSSGCRSASRSATGSRCTCPRRSGIDSRWGAAGITLASGLAAGVEYLLLRRALGARIGPTRSDWGLLARLWAAATARRRGRLVGRLALPPLHPIPAAVLILGVFGATYLAARRCSACLRRGAAAA